MTGKADFTQDEWATVLEGPPSAGLIVATAARGGTIRETFAIARAYADARVSRILAGSSEVMKVIISRSLGL